MSLMALLAKVWLLIFSILILPISGTFGVPPLLTKPAINSLSGPAAKTKQNAIKMMNSGKFVLWLASIFSSLVTFGRFDTQKNIATAIYKPASMKYRLLIAVILTSIAGINLLALPNKTMLTITGPNKVPKLFTPPARFNRLAPVSGVPSAITNGLAAVCCSEKPNAMTKKAPKMKPNDPESTAGTINNAPTADKTKPQIIPFL